ncbi:GAF domain-containing protein [Desulfolutivibrio sulfoxidireducens]|uniref:GAF domain-containing protein n=1 Tax=Desulfolutivibrio sulfoxidireducens TaxID=2773299 RepID=UPI00159E3F61|nr:GAF domain-containing protein [Desulfolutivibrio sulfoxidireducens]QLA17370.1 GAF domain-containing protein [Desulfolutivibrio sulfoxidireducens]QLA20967.1 GAF domain-containing protein [Desulfolutivibrio sulfoxidireducens]
MDRFERFYRGLHEAVRAINSSLDPGTVLEKIVEYTAKAMDAKGCTLRLLDKSGKKLRAGATYGLSRNYLRKGPVEVAKSEVDRAALTEGGVICIADACNDPRFQYPEAAREEGIRAVAVAALRVEGKAIGVLRIYSDAVREFDEAEKEFLRTIADLSAIAIENARLHQALKTDYEMLTAYEYRIFED